MKNETPKIHIKLQFFPTNFATIMQAKTCVDANWNATASIIQDLIYKNGAYVQCAINHH